ncbi:LuxR C-terminal-related transcriptional regulator [Georgenia sp. SYP-B2076]|uniref:helix-turn-helix transcriptional regulator n=1 Tax=Georgenia sp. SYP-B2076 TaxID=2495881 RepID=UPI000F8EB647|nr:LuxR C-terminal-related transcriptional regulator [Georgenia sp. SYP-B2076]
MDPQAPVPALLEARLTVPQLSAGVVRRERVLGLLDDAVRHPVTLVTGGAGAGKTYAVAGWVRAGHPPGPVVWASLDRTERDAHRLWTTVLLAVRGVLGDEVLGGLTVPPVPDEDFVALVCARLPARPLVLVLDDLHELEGGNATESLEPLLRSPPPRVALVLVSRHDPALPLHRLRIAGDLGELRAADLAFTEAEASRLLEDRDVPLPEPALGRLMETTEGWAAGLRLATLALEAAADPVRAVGEFDGRHSLVTGYLGGEVLRGLGADRSEFLLRTSVTDRVCAPLARAITGEESAGAILESLVRDNVLVVELDGGWYRYHPLLLQMLRTRLEKERPDLRRELGRRAVAWLEAAGEGLAALGLVLDSDDRELMGRVALRSAATQIFTAGRGELGATLGRIPPEAALDDAELALALALGAFCRDDDDAAALLRRAEPGLGTLPDPRRTVAAVVLRILQATAAERAGDPVRMVRAARRADRLARTLTTADAGAWAAYRGAAGGLLGVGELWLGRPRRALDLLRAALADARAGAVHGSGEVHLRGYVALAEGGLGLVERSRAEALRALRAAESQGTSRSPETGAALLALAAAGLERGELGEVDRVLGDAREARGHDPFVGAGLRLAATYRRLIAGDVAGARRGLADVDAWLRRYPGMIHLVRLRTALVVDVELAAGAPERARAVLVAHDDAAGRPAARDADESAPEVDVIALARAGVLLATGQADQVRPALAGLLASQTSWAARAWGLVGLAEDRMRHDASAGEAIARALGAADAAGTVAYLLHTTGRLDTLLRRHLEVAGTHRGPAGQALAASRRVPAPVGAGHPPEALTDRELSVVAFLPMSTNAEIADELGISVNTVKQHLKSINRKLGVTSRRDAVRVVGRLGLLPESVAPARL